MSKNTLFFSDNYLKKRVIAEEYLDYIGNTMVVMS